MQVQIIGNYFDSSGYAIHTRNLANALCKLTNIRLTTNCPPGWERLINDKELEMIKRKPEKDEINLIITHPMNWKMNLGKRNIVYLVWEGDKVPECFIEECLNPEIEKIIVPSEHTKQALHNTLFQNKDDFISLFKNEVWNKTVTIPHGVDLNLFYSKEIKKDKFTFIANKGFRNMQDRGGIQYLLQAFNEEFKSGEAELIIKINQAYGMPDLEKIFELLKIGNRDDIKIDARNYDYKDLVNFYNLGNVFVSPTRAEAFNIPCIEAMACGLPVITTEFGGQTDYCSMETGWIIPGELEEVKHEIQYEGIKWFTPDIKKLREAMRQAFDDHKTCKILGETALNKARLFTWDSTAEKILSLLKPFNVSSEVVGS